MGSEMCIRDRLSKGAGGQAKPVAEPAAGIDHDKRQVLGQCRVLEAVIEKDRPCARGC